MEIIKDKKKLEDKCESIEVTWDKTRKKFFFNKDSEVRDIIVNLKETLREYPDGVGLAAPQIGINKDMFVIRFANNDYRAFINPTMLNCKGLMMSKESCLSFPGKEYLRPRYSYIVAEYTNANGQHVSQPFYGMTAIIYQHELDHLNGITLPDLSIEVPKNYDNMTDDEKQNIINEYLTSIQNKYDEVKKEIDSNPELKKINDAIDFMESARKGDTKVEAVKLDDDTSKKIADKVEKSIKEEMKTKKETT